MTKKTIILFLSLITFFLSWGIQNVVFSQSSLDPLTLPPLTALVTDWSNVVDATTLSGLQAQALTIEQQTTAQIASVLFPHRNGHELFDIGMRLFRESGIGQEGKNNGTLLLIATEEKKLRIIVGYGLEGAFPDIRARDLIEGTLRPLVDTEQRAAAIQAYHQAAQLRLEEVGADSTSGIPTTNYTLNSRDFLFFLLWCLATFRSFRLLNTKKTSLPTQVSPLFPFAGLFLLIALGLPGIVGAFFGYFSGIVLGLLAYPRIGGNSGNFTPWGGSWGAGGGGGFSSGGGFGGFGGGSSGGGGAGD